MGRGRSWDPGPRRNCSMTMSHHPHSSTHCSPRRRLRAHHSTKHPQQRSKQLPSQHRTWNKPWRPSRTSKPSQHQRSHNHTASGDTPQDHYQPPGPGAQAQQAELQLNSTTGGRAKHLAGVTPKAARSITKSGSIHHMQDTTNKQQQLAHPARRGHPAQQPSNGDVIPLELATRRTRNKADKTWIHAEFAKRGWHKPPHLTWRQVEHWLHSREQRAARGPMSSRSKPPARTHQPGRFTQLLNLHLQPREPPQRTTPQTGPSSTAASSSQAPPPQQPRAGGTGADGRPSQRKTTTSKQATRARSSKQRSGWERHASHMWQPRGPPPSQAIPTLDRGRPHPSESTTQ